MKLYTVRVARRDENGDPVDFKKYTVNGENFEEAYALAEKAAGEGYICYDAWEVEQ
jgi:hypothetical protein